MRHFFAFVLGLTALCVASASAYAQNKEEPRSYTGAKETSEWISLGNIEDVKYECDLKSIIRTDSTHIRIHIKETPIRQNHYETVRTKMWEHRSIQGYSDSLRKKPEFCFDGYERYSFSISEELVEYNKGEYSVTYVADYDISGMLLPGSETVYMDKQVADKSPERMVIDLLLKGKTKLGENN